MEEFFIPMVKRLTLGDWFTSRSSACSLYAPIYQAVSVANQDDLRKYYFSFFYFLFFFNLDILLNCVMMILQWFVVLLLLIYL